MKKQLLGHPLLVFFAVFILIVSVADMLISNKEFSEVENRYLQLKPKLTMRDLISGKYREKYEDYISDQFVLRDQWINLKSRSEYLIGKQENNNIIYGKDNYMFARYDSVDTAQLEKNTASVREFFELYADIPATIAIIPNSYMVLHDKLPFGLKMVDQYSYIDQIYAGVNLSNVSKLSLRESLEKHTGNYIYYMTDHHWTTFGAYLAYSDFVRSRGYEPVEYNELSGTEVPGFYGTFYSKAKLFKTVPDIITYFDVPVADITIEGERTVLNSQNQEVPVEGLYYLEQFEQRDKYSAFLYGNNGITVIKSDGNRNHSDGETSRILVIKDSYGNSFVPYLVYNYDEIFVVDLRAIPFQMSEFMAENQFDEILLLYNFDNFVNDKNFPRLTY